LTCLISYNIRDTQSLATRISRINELPTLLVEDFCDTTNGERTSNLAGHGRVASRLWNAVTIVPGFASLIVVYRRCVGKCSIPSANGYGVTASVYELGSQAHTVRSGAKESLIPCGSYIPNDI
jgi:hypothetical protein